MIEYVNDYRHNYLTVSCEDEEDFSLRMLMENEIPGLLRPEIRHMDGVSKLFYCISGKQSIINYFIQKTIDKKTFFDLLHSIYQLRQSADEYFLSCCGIALSPEMIFWNMEEHKFEFLYIPSSEEKMNMTELADFLVSKIDYMDEKFSDFVYQFCEDIYEDKWNFEKYIDEEKCFTDVEPNLIENEKLVWDEEDANVEEDKTGDNDKNKYKEAVFEEDPFEIESYATEHSRKTDKKTKNEMRKKKTSFLSGVVAHFLEKKRLGKEYEEKTGDEFREDIDYDLSREYGAIREPEMKYIAEKNKTNKAVSFYGEKNPEEAKDTKTVFFDVASERENKLYSIGKKHSPNIELSVLPCIVGKDESMADHCVSDKSVSRMHVRFFEEDGACWMQDLNSTNGTYHNGLRLKPNQRVLLESEDEIGIGQLIYIYR